MNANEAITDAFNERKEDEAVDNVFKPNHANHVDRKSYFDHYDKELADRITEIKANQTR